MINKNSSDESAYNDCEEYVDEKWKSCGLDGSEAEEGISDGFEESRTANLGRSYHHLPRRHREKPFTEISDEDKSHPHDPQDGPISVVLG